MAAAVLFDAMGTLFDLSALDVRFAAVGGGPATRAAWYERLLDSSKTLTMTGAYEPFDELARSTLRTTLASEGLDPDGAQGILDGLEEAPAYPEARGAVVRLAETGVPALVLTNGGAQSTRTLLERASLELDVLSSEELRTYKPAAGLYLAACERCGLPPERVSLVAAHGWDVLGALAAGLGAVWIDRSERCWPFPGDEPAPRAGDLDEAVRLAVAP